MKINCTVKEKESLIDIFTFVCSTEVCPFLNECDNYECCTDVLKNEIEWVISDK